MASMRDIKRRKTSIQSTQQITKAMKLVATVKLQKAKLNAEKSKSYFNYMYSTINSILEKTKNVNHPFLKCNDSPRKMIILITSNRGLAGGYDGNIVKMITSSDLPLEQIDIIAMGKKGKDAMNRNKVKIIADECVTMDGPIYADAARIAKIALDAFLNRGVGEIYVAYTAFKNTMTHIPTLLKLLPIMPLEESVDDGSDKKQGKKEKSAETLMNFEPEEEEALDLIVPKYVSSLIYGAIVEAIASENGARMQAMDSATSNAEDMINKLALQYNRARQGAITQELTEIIAGAEAIS